MKVQKKGKLHGITVLHYTAYDNLPGAAKSAYNIHKTLESEGANSTMVVRRKGSEDPSVIEAKKGLIYYLQSATDTIRSMLGIKKGTDQRLNSNTNKHIKIKSLFPYKKTEVDDIFMYWITDFLDTNAQEEIYRYYNCPIVWVLMDMEPITGGCHQSMECVRYRDTCGKCKILKSNTLKDATYRNIIKKIRIKNRGTSY